MQVHRVSTVTDYTSDIRPLYTLTESDNNDNNNSINSFKPLRLSADYLDQKIYGKPIKKPDINANHYQNIKQKREHENISKLKLNEIIEYYNTINNKHDTQQIITPQQYSNKRRLSVQTIPDYNPDPQVLSKVLTILTPPTPSRSGNNTNNFSNSNATKARIIAQQAIELGKNTKQIEELIQYYPADNINNNSNTEVKLMHQDVFHYKANHNISKFNDPALIQKFKSYLSYFNIPDINELIALILCELPTDERNKHALLYASELLLFELRNKYIECVDQVVYDYHQKYLINENKLNLNTMLHPLANQERQKSIFNINFQRDYKAGLLFNQVLDKLRDYYEAVPNQNYEQYYTQHNRNVSLDSVRSELQAVHSHNGSNATHNDPVFETKVEVDEANPLNKIQVPKLNLPTQPSSRSISTSRPATARVTARINEIRLLENESGLMLNNLNRVSSEIKKYTVNIQQQQSQQPQTARSPIQSINASTIAKSPSNNKIRPATARVAATPSSNTSKLFGRTAARRAQLSNLTQKQTAIIERHRDLHPGAKLADLAKHELDEKENVDKLQQLSTKQARLSIDYSAAEADIMQILSGQIKINNMEDAISISNINNDNKRITNPRGIIKFQSMHDTKINDYLLKLNEMERVRLRNMHEIDVKYYINYFNNLFKSMRENYNNRVQDYNNSVRKLQYESRKLEIEFKKKDRDFFHNIDNFQEYHRFEYEIALEKALKTDDNTNTTDSDGDYSFFPSFRNNNNFKLNCNQLQQSESIIINNLAASKLLLKPPPITVHLTQFDINDSKPIPDNIQSQLGYELLLLDKFNYDGVRNKHLFTEFIDENIVSNQDNNSGTFDFSHNNDLFPIIPTPDYYELNLPAQMLDQLNQAHRAKLEAEIQLEAHKSKAHVKSNKHTMTIAKKKAANNNLSMPNQRRRNSQQMARDILNKINNLKQTDDISDNDNDANNELSVNSNTTDEEQQLENMNSLEAEVESKVQDALNVLQPILNPSHVAIVDKSSDNEDNNQKQANSEVKEANVDKIDNSAENERAVPSGEELYKEALRKAGIDEIVSEPTIDSTAEHHAEYLKAKQIETQLIAALNQLQSMIHKPKTDNNTIHILQQQLQEIATKQIAINSALASNTQESEISINSMVIHADTDTEQKKDNSNATVDTKNNNRKAEDIITVDKHAEEIFEDWKLSAQQQIERETKLPHENVVPLQHSRSINNEITLRNYRINQNEANAIRKLTDTDLHIETKSASEVISQLQSVIKSQMQTLIQTKARQLLIDKRAQQRLQRKLERKNKRKQQKLERKLAKKQAKLEKLAYKIQKQVKIDGKIDNTEKQVDLNLNTKFDKLLGFHLNTYQSHVTKALSQHYSRRQTEFETNLESRLIKIFERLQYSDNNKLLFINKYSNQPHSFQLLNVLQLLEPVSLQIQQRENLVKTLRNNHKDMSIGLYCHNFHGVDYHSNLYYLTNNIVEILVQLKQQYDEVVGYSIFSNYIDKVLTDLHYECCENGISLLNKLQSITSCTVNNNTNVSLSTFRKDMNNKKLHLLLNLGAIDSTIHNVNYNDYNNGANKVGRYVPLKQQDAIVKLPQYFIPIVTANASLYSKLTYNAFNVYNYQRLLEYNENQIQIDDIQYQLRKQKFLQVTKIYAEQIEAMQLPSSNNKKDNNHNNYYANKLQLQQQIVTQRIEINHTQVQVEASKRSVLQSINTNRESNTTRPSKLINSRPSTVPSTVTNIGNNNNLLFLHIHHTTGLTSRSTRLQTAIGQQRNNDAGKLQGKVVSKPNTPRVNNQMPRRPVTSKPINNNGNNMLKIAMRKQQQLMKELGL